MKRLTKILGIVVVLGIGIFLGLTYHNNTSYSDAIAQGKSAVESADYKQAKSLFSSALDVKPDSDRAETFLDQTKDYVSAKQAQKNGNLDDALDSYSSVVEADGGLAVLKTRAKKQIKVIKEQTENEWTKDYAGKDTLPDGSKITSENISTVRQNLGSSKTGSYSDGDLKKIIWFAAQQQPPMDVSDVMNNPDYLNAALTN